MEQFVIEGYAEWIINHAQWAVALAPGRIVRPVTITGPFRDFVWVSFPDGLQTRFSFIADDAIVRPPGDHGFGKEIFGYYQLTEASMAALAEKLPPATPLEDC
jgi:hypothetical protein